VLQVILSAREHELLLADLKYCNVLPHFSKVVGTKQSSREKLEQARELLFSLGVPSSEVVLVGDTVHDYSVAMDLGIDCALTAIG
jgi:phosphoglycolate phosphatase